MPQLIPYFVGAAVGAKFGTIAAFFATLASSLVVAPHHGNTARRRARAELLRRLASKPASG